MLYEVITPHRENVSYFGNGDEAHAVYQFSLPPLLLQALHSGRSTYLQRWAESLEAPVIDQSRLFSDNSVLRGHRITSYNVCYTKLLRTISWTTPRSGTGRAGPPRCPCWQAPFSVP